MDVMYSGLTQLSSRQNAVIPATYYVLGDAPDSLDPTDYCGFF